MPRESDGGDEFAFRAHMTIFYVFRLIFAFYHYQFATRSKLRSRNNHCSALSKDAATPPGCGLTPGYAIRVLIKRCFCSLSHTVTIAIFCKHAALAFQCLNIIIKYFINYSNNKHKAGCRITFLHALVLATK